MNKRPDPADSGDYVLDAQGQPLLDRYGRPIRRRTSTPRIEPRDLPRQQSRQHNQPARPQPPRRADGHSGQGSRAAGARDPRLDPDQIRRRAAQARAEDGGKHRRTQGPAQPQTRAMPAAGAAGAAAQRPQRPHQGPAHPQEIPAQSARPRSAGHTRVNDPRFPPPGYQPGAPGQPGAGPRGHGVPPQRAPQRVQPQRRGAPPRRRKQRQRRRGCLRRPVTALLTVLLVLVGGLFIYGETKLNHTEVFAGLANRPSHSPSVNWLLVGSDSRAGLTAEQDAELSGGGAIEGQRTDTIMILHIPVIGKPTLVSIPRDSYVNVPGFGMQKINAAFAFGGAPLLVETVEQSTGVRINHYAEIGFGGFANIVDAAGGIELCPPEPIDDPMAGINVPAGCKTYQGPEALGYVRSRATANGDLDRVERQREFMGALMSRLRSPSVLLNPLRMMPVTDAAASAVTVADGDHSWNLAWLMLRVAFGMESETVPTEGSMSTDVGDVLLWNDAEAQELFQRLR
ncbi:LCP family protein [Corynebacterium sp. TAE3-ERU12]|uniref:LCP family glycopolymer transferase n=1 Tax=Corynebacterium sp. TAE3-ERU12 TaxID=2849491 RepID=UPI001C436AC2|nr:LCP family protein [Corynebacterium sp. TAE3-ERU12]MBV7296086.1 LCP family protein [Corynebacterium sp. TAE3-ERU12]